MKTYRLLKALTLIAIISITASCGKEEKVQEEILRPIEHIKVSYKNTVPERTFSGTARTEKIVNLSFRGSGILTSFDVKLGQRVKKGELLGKLDNVQARLNYEKAITSVNSAESQMNTAKLSLDRFRVLYEKGSASLSDFESAKNSYRNAQQSYESAKRSVNLQQEQINYGYLYASEDGVITSVLAEVDENVSPGQTVGVLNAGTEMEIALGLPESIINIVEVGKKVEVNFSSIGDQVFHGSITELSPAIDNNTATYPTRIQLNDTSKEVKSGMAASVTFKMDGDKNNDPIIRIPAQSVGEDSDGRFVFLVEDNNGSAIVKKQPVEVANLNSDGFEVTKGLSVGQVIATAGLQTLLDGQKVRLN